MQHQLRKYLQQTPPGVCLPWSTFQQVDKMSLCIGGLWKVGFDQFFSQYDWSFSFIWNCQGCRVQSPWNCWMPLKKEVIDITCNQHCPNKSEQVLKLQLAFARQACFGNGVSWVAGTICISMHLNVFTLVASIISLLPILTVVLFGLWSLV